MIKVNPLKRIQIKDVLNHPYFKDCWWININKSFEKILRKFFSYLIELLFSFFLHLHFILNDGSQILCWFNELIDQCISTDERRSILFFFFDSAAISFKQIVYPFHKRWLNDFLFYFRLCNLYLLERFTVHRFSL